MTNRKVQISDDITLAKGEVHDRLCQLQDLIGTILEKQDVTTGMALSLFLNMYVSTALAECITREEVVDMTSKLYDLYIQDEKEMHTIN